VKGDWSALSFSFTTTDACASRHLPQHWGNPNSPTRGWENRVFADLTSTPVKCRPGAIGMWRHVPVRYTDVRPKGMRWSSHGRSRRRTASVLERQNRPPLAPFSSCSMSRAPLRLLAVPEHYIGILFGARRPE